MYSTDVDAG